MKLIDEAGIGLEKIIDFIDKKYSGNRPKKVQEAIEIIENELIGGEN
jgi:hypothetical protein